MRQHRPLFVILILFAVAVLAQQAVLPLFEGSDEPLHYAYIEHLRATGSLPDRDERLSSATRQESGQPPLTYIVGALLADTFRLPALPDLMPQTRDALVGKTRNPWNTPGNIWNRVDNHNYYYNSANADPEIARAMYSLRLTSLVYGIIAIIGAYGAASEIFDRREWVIVSTVLFAFMPTFVHSAAYINNDVNSTAFCTLTLWQLLRLLRLGASTKRLLLIGLLIALAALSKVNSLGILPAAGLALLLDWRRQGYSFGRFLKFAVILAIPIVLLFGPWLLYGLVRYGDPFGFNTHPLGNFLTLQELMPQFPNIYLSYFARFGLSIYFYPLTYTLFGVLLTLAVTEYGLAAWRWRQLRENRVLHQALVLGAAALVAFAGLIRWMQLLPEIPARLLYPAHLSLVILLTGGLFLLARRWEIFDRPLRLYAIGLTAGTGLIGGSIAVYAAYTPPPLTERANLPPLKGTPFIFEDSVAFLGYTQDTQRLSGTWYPMTLCWEILKMPPSEPAYSLKLIGDDGILTDRTTIFGLGQRNSALWNVGDIFCDNVELPLVGRIIEPARAYNVILVMLNAETFAIEDWQAATSDGNPIDIPILTQAFSPAGDMSTDVPEIIAADISFPGFATLKGYHIDGNLQPGETAILKLLWEVSGTTLDNFAQFIHLSGTNGSISLADGIPRHEEYPTFAWARGETVADKWTLHLPDDLPPDEYSIGIGFYRPDSGARMSAVQNNAPAADNIATLLTVSLK